MLQIYSSDKSEQKPKSTTLSNLYRPDFATKINFPNFQNNLDRKPILIWPVLLIIVTFNQLSGDVLRRRSYNLLILCCYNATKKEYRKMSKTHRHLPVFSSKCFDSFLDTISLRIFSPVLTFMLIKLGHLSILYQNWLELTFFQRESASIFDRDPALFPMEFYQCIVFWVYLIFIQIIGTFPLNGDNI